MDVYPDSYKLTLFIIYGFPKAGQESTTPDIPKKNAFKSSIWKNWKTIITIITKNCIILLFFYAVHHWSIWRSISSHRSTRINTAQEFVTQYSIWLTSCHLFWFDHKISHVRLPIWRHNIITHVAVEYHSKYVGLSLLTSMTHYTTQTDFYWFLREFACKIV